MNNEYSYIWHIKIGLLRKYSIQDRKFIFYRIVSDIFYAAAVILTAFFGAQMLREAFRTGLSPEVFLLMLVAFAMTAVVPAALGLGVMESGINRCASPFCERSNEYITLYKDHAEFYFKEAGNSGSGQLRSYRISRENISRVDYDGKDHIIIISGRGELLSYDDSAPTGTDHFRTDPVTFEEDTPFMILDAFKAGDSETVMKALRGMAQYGAEAEEGEEKDGAAEVMTETTAEEQKQSGNRIGKFAAGIVVENEVGAAVMVAAFAGLLLFILTDMITSITMDEHIPDLIILLFGAAVFIGFAGPLRTMIVMKTRKWERLIRDVNTSAGDLCEETAEESKNIFFDMAQTEATAVSIAMLKQVDNASRALAEAYGKKIPKLFMKSLAAALVLFTAIDIWGASKAAMTYHYYLEKRASTVKSLNEVFPEDQVDPYGRYVRKNTLGIDYNLDDSRLIMIDMDKSGNITEIRYYLDGTKDKSGMSAYVDKINSRLKRTGRVSQKFTGSVPQELLDKFDPKDEETEAETVQGGMTYRIDYEIRESYDDSPDMNELEYDVRCSDINDK